jgi:anti-sigma B factor antagonist
MKFSLVVVGSSPRLAALQEGGLVMSVELDTWVCASHVVVALRGELDTVDAASTAAAVSAAAMTGQSLILDLAALDFIDCSALGALLGVQERARQAGGGVLLAGPQERVLRIRTLTGLAAGVYVYASVAAAVPTSAAAPPWHAAGRPAASIARPGRTAPFLTGTG